MNHLSFVNLVLKHLYSSRGNVMNGHAWKSRIQHMQQSFFFLGPPSSGVPRGGGSLPPPPPPPKKKIYGKMYVSECINAYKWKLFLPNSPPLPLEDSWVFHCLRGTPPPPPPPRYPLDFGAMHYQEVHKTPVQILLSSASKRNNKIRYNGAKSYL